MVATTALGLLPLACWWVGVQVAPRAVALAAALAVPWLPPVVALVGQPTDYGLSALLQILSLGFGLALARTGRVAAALGAGLSLGALGLATPKALVVLLVALPLAVLSLPWRRPGWALLGLGAVLLPVWGAWRVYAVLDPPRHSLEHALVVVELDYAKKQGVALRAEDYGMPGGAPAQERGSWRWGDAQALRRLPETLGALTRRPPGYPPLAARWPSVLRGYAHALGRAEWPRGFWALGVLGLLGAARGVSAWRGLLATGLALALVGGSAWGAMRVEHTDRYALPVLVLLPTLLGAGASLAVGSPAWLAQRLRGRAPWVPPSWALLPLPAVVALALWRSPEGLGRLPAHRLAQEEAARRATHPLNQLLALRSQLEPGDVVQDATSQLSASAILMGKAQLRRPNMRSLLPPVEYGPVQAERAFVVFECAMSACNAPELHAVQRQLAHDPRYVQVAPWIYQDLTPDRTARIGGSPEGPADGP